MARNFSDLCAAFSALITLAKRKSLKTADLGKVTPLGMGGPNGGTSFDRETPTLEIERKKNQWLIPKKWSGEKQNCDLGSPLTQFSLALTMQFSDI